MRKLIAVVMILALLIPGLALADYSSGLGMTMDTFMMKYNSVTAPLGAPYEALETPYNWSNWSGYNSAWFFADKDRKVTILLMTKEPGKNNTTSAGLDMIQIFVMSDGDFIPLTSVATRCATVFCANLLGTPLAPMQIGSLISYYYESNCREKGLTAYNGLDENRTLGIALFYDAASKCFYYQICPMEEMK